jgi:Protein of unknown function (DUF3175)
VPLQPGATATIELQCVLAIEGDLGGAADRGGTATHPFGRLVQRALSFTAAKSEALIHPMASPQSKSRPGSKTRRWSARVTQTSNALDLESRVFARPDARSIARSLKRSAERSRRRKADPFRSAMSMLTFYINRAGKNLPKRRLAILEHAKDELRVAFHRPLRKTASRRKVG